MCEYTGLNDPMRYAYTPSEPAVVLSACKKYLVESRKDIVIVGIAPFCADNPAPEVC